MMTHNSNDVIAPTAA